jgi:hypothetical protein
MARRSRIIRQGAVPNPVPHWVPVAVAAVAGAAVGAGAAYALLGAPRPVPGEPQAMAAFELAIGGRKYALAEDRPFFITDAEGKPVRAVLSRAGGLKFDRYGVSFKYPASMRVKAFEKGGSALIKIRSLDSPEVVIRAFDPPASLDLAEKNIRQEMTEELTAAGAELVEGSQRPVTRTIGGAKVRGTEAEYELHNLRLHQELYAFEGESKVFSLVLQHHRKEGALAKRYFGIILGSLK